MNCLECQDVLQKRLDGERVPVNDALDRHLSECPVCRDLHGGAARLLEGLKQIPQPQLAPDFARSLATQVIQDRRERRAKGSRRVFVTIALAASVVLILLLAYHWVPRQQHNEKHPGGDIAQVQEAPPPSPPLPPKQVPEPKPAPRNALTSLTDRIADTTGLQTLLVAARASGSALQIRAQGGVQYDTPHIRYGAAIRSPGLTMRREGTVTIDGTLDMGRASLGASLFDGNARFEYHLPWELQGGAAYVADRVELEVDLQGYTSIPAYSLLASSQPTLIYGDAGGGGPASVFARPFGGLTSASDGVVDVAVGGHFRPVRQRNLRVHGGFAASRSPVSAGDQVFNDVDLSWSAGVSGSVAKLQFAVGLNYRVGTATDVLVRNLLNGGPLLTRIDVHTGGMIYSLVSVLMSTRIRHQCCGTKSL